jgi:hypothetical protein
MERELWPLLYRELRLVARGFSQKYVQIPPWVLVAVTLWAALHDRPWSWACDPRNWAGTSLRPPRLPSASTVSRRAHSVGVGLLRRALEQRLRDRQEPDLAAILDGKPLPVGGYTKDKDAAYGHGAGLMAKGYKLHAAWAGRCLPEAWDVTPLNVSEKAVAEALLAQPPMRRGGYLLGDKNYDSSGLFDAAAAAGYQLVVPQGHANAGKGHRYQSPHRLRGIEMARPGRGKSTLGRDLLAGRAAIERSFGNAGSFGGGLGPLPAWARRLRRVRTWVWDKLLINAVRILDKQGLMTSLQ